MIKIINRCFEQHAKQHIIAVIDITSRVSSTPSDSDYSAHNELIFMH